MAGEAVIGALMRHCRVRRDRRSFYFTDTGPSAGQGGTLCFIMDGRARFRVKGVEFTAVKNDVVCWDPGGLEEMRPLPGMRVSYCVLGPELYTDGGATVNLSVLGLPSVIRPRRPRPVWALLRSLHDAFLGRQERYLETCSMLCLKLFELLRNMPAYKRAPEPLPAADERIRKTLTFIADRYKEKHTIAELAKMACMHPVHYIRCFKRLMGVTPYRYLLERKIEKAKDFLQLYDDPPAVVGQEFGFHDYAHFHRTFKRLMVI